MNSSSSSSSSWTRSATTTSTSERKTSGKYSPNRSTHSRIVSTNTLLSAKSIHIWKINQTYVLQSSQDEWNYLSVCLLHTHAHSPMCMSVCLLLITNLALLLQLPCRTFFWFRAQARDAEPPDGRPWDLWRPPEVPTDHSRASGEAAVGDQDVKKATRSTPGARLSNNVLLFNNKTIDEKIRLVWAFI